MKQNLLIIIIMKIAIFGSKHQKKEQVEKLFELLEQNKVEIYIQNK